MKFEVGNVVRVTGDNKTFGHAFDAGTLGTIKAVDPRDTSYSVEGVDRHGNTESWWVYEDDLEPVSYRLNEKTLVAALKIVGVPEAQHDQIIRAYNTITEVLA